jgi:hypothetical protein
MSATRSWKRVHAVIALLAACGTSHEPGVVEIDRNDCVACHLADYEGAQAPVHVGNMPTTCGLCHSTTGWRPAASALHPETRFPITRGPHQLDCATCHNPALGAVPSRANTDCIGCHLGEHTLTRMNEKHREVGDYVPDPGRPNFCLDCHPDGGGD